LRFGVYSYMRNAIVFLVLCGLAGGGAYYYYTHARNSKPSESLFRTAKVSRGDLLVTVSANGTVEPEEVVDVGTQVMGRIKELGTDPRGTSNPKFAGKSIDYGSPVEKGMLLAQIDPSIYKAQFDQAHGTVEQAKANVIQSEAKLMQTDAEWKRAQRLRALNLRGTSPTGSADSNSNMPIKGISDADFILAQANYEVAKANVAVAKATVEQQTASLALAETNLGYTTIRSPVSGTIIDRRVNIGQTVVASLNAPSLFLIARDLRRMQVWASVNEADIGRIKVGTQVHFRVDAFPDDVFRGEVVQVRLNASMTQNVVTFTVVIFVENPDLKLLPYLTADVKFEVDERKDVMLVPNSALRFRPKPEQIARGPSSSNKEHADAEPDNQQADRKSEHDSKPAANVGTVWGIDQETSLLHAIPVTVGLSDGTMTEVSGEHLSEGTVVVLGENRTIVTEEVNNPLGPPKFRGNRSQNKESK